QAVDVVEHGDRSARRWMPGEEPIQEQSSMTPARRLLDAGNRLEMIRFAVLGLAFAVAEAVQTDVGGHPIKQARWILHSKACPPLDEEDEHVLAGIERLVFVAKQLTATPQHHGSVPAAEPIDLRLVYHPAGITPQAPGSVTVSPTPSKELPMKAVALALVLGLAGSIAPAVAQTPESGLTLTTLSGRPDVASGGDVLVAVGLPAGAQSSEARITLNGADVTRAFRPGDTPRMLVGLITGLKDGSNEIAAAA